MIWQYIYIPLLLLAAPEIPEPLPAKPESIETDAAIPDIVGTAVDSQRRMTVPVRIGGKGPYNFLIDTGAERTVVSQALASSLSLESGEQARLMGMAGIKVVNTAYLPGLRVGQQNYEEVLAPLLDAADMGAEGILGLDSLQGQKVVFDFRRKRIEIERKLRLSDRAGYEIVVRAKRRGEQLILANAVISGIKVDVVIDTGSQWNIANRALQEKLRQKNREPGTSTQLVSVTGQTIPVYSTFARNFRIGQLKYDILHLAFADAPPFVHLGLEDKPAIFLGMRALNSFDRIAIDFINRKVYFDVPSERPATDRLRL